ncbi:MAG: biopolymer transporter ExbD [Planctomycetaceae bacterium]|nr:biopolymer transporter ExbD [Planctomycetaceae bacterium]
MMRRGLSFGNANASSWGKRQRGGSSTELDITPMIDVTFLLLIFFMVTSTMSSQQRVDVPPARNGVNVEQTSAILIVIRSPLTTGGEPTIELNGEERTLSDVGPFVREENAAGKTNVVVRAGREVPHGFVRQVIQEANLIDELEFSFGVEDERGS